MTRVLAFDPGVTTGIAAYNGLNVMTDERRFDHQDLYAYIGSIVHVGGYELVCERFTYQQRTKVELFPVEMIGVIKLAAQDYDLKLTIQTPSQAKNLWTDTKLRKLELWTPSQGHGMDALRHLLYYLVVTKGDRTWLNRLKPENL